MVKVKLRDISQPTFLHGFHVLSNSDKLSPHVVYRLSFQVEAIQDALDRMNAARLAMAEKWADKYDDGSTKRIQNPNGTFSYELTAPGAKEGFEKELEQLQEEEVDLPEPKVRISDIWPNIISGEEPEKDDAVKLPASSMKKLLGILLLDA